MKEYISRKEWSGDTPNTLGPVKKQLRRALMKRLLTLLLVSFLIAAVFQFAPTRGQSGTACDSSCVVNTSRTIMTTAWGTTITNDTVTLVSAAQPIGHMGVGFPAELASDVRNVTAVDTSGNALALTMMATPSYTLYDATLRSPSSSYTFTVRTVFTGLLRFKSAGSQFNFTFSPFPVTDYNVSQARLSVVTQGWSNPTAYKVNGTFANGVFSTQPAALDAFDMTVASISFTSASQNLFDASADRTLTILSSGTVTASDDYNLTNHGPILQNIAFALPKDVKSLSAVDAIGPLDSTSITSGGTASTNSTWRVTPRYGSINTNQSVVISLRYDLPGSIVSSPSLGTFSITYNLLNNVQFYQSILSAKLVTPMGFRQLSLASPVTPTVSGSTLTGNQYVFTAFSVGPGSNLSLSMSYVLSPFWASLAPLAWVVLLELAVVFAVLVYEPGSGRTVLVGGGPMDLIRRFVDLYDEKSTLRQEADRIDDDMTRGAMNRHEYKHRRRLIEIRMSEIDRSLGPVKAQLSSASSRYRDMIRRVERSEADLQVVRTGLVDLRNQYRSGRMEKSLYESLMSDLERRKVRDRQAIDNVIITLREEIR